MITKITLSISVLASMMLVSEAIFAAYGKRLCQSNSYYKCLKVKAGQSWARLFPNQVDRDIVKRVNRMNIRLRKGQIIAVPRGLKRLTRMDVSPFPFRIASTGRKQVRFDYSLHAWGAYDEQGDLVNWGPASGGRKWCADTKSECRTVKGTFNIYHSRGPNCKSNKFPLATKHKKAGGAPMPYCMFFHGGYALHGSYTVPGYHASHGCVRLFPEDARWLHEEFVDLPGRDAGSPRTRVKVTS